MPLSATTVRRILEDLQAFGLVHCEKGGPGHADEWSLVPEARQALLCSHLTLPTSLDHTRNPMRLR